MPFSCFEYVYIIFHVATSLLFVDSILSNRGRKQQLRHRNEVLNYHVHLLPPPIFFILVKIVIASFLFSGSLPVIIRASRAFSSVFRSIRHRACERKRERKRVAIITAGGIERFTRQHRASRDRNVTRCMCRAMRVESDDGLNKQSRTRVSREIHSFVWYPPRPSPPTPRLHFPCSLSSPFLASVHRSFNFYEPVYMSIGATYLRRLPGLTSFRSTDERTFFFLFLILKIHDLYRNKSS